MKYEPTGKTSLGHTLAPNFSYRVTIDDIRSTYGSGAAAFESGDFLNAAQMASRDSEIRGCSLILSGLSERGLEVLEKATGRLSGRVKLCQAFALWSLDRDDEARAVLQTLKNGESAKQAQRFLQLLNRNDIKVFITAAFISLFHGQRPESTFSSSYQYGPFTTKYVGTQMENNAYSYRSNEPFDEFIDSLPDHEKPDVIFALSPQWLLPKNFHKVNVPKVLWSHDPDVFLYRNRENYSLYDVIICISSQEHFEMSRSSNAYCAANIMLHPLHVPFPLAKIPKEKKIDLLFTGSALSSFHTEKPRFMYQVSELQADYNVVVIDTHLPDEQYFEMLAQTKFLPVVGRHAGTPSPRWREALTCGSCVLFPEGTFYDEIAPGCFPFRTHSIAADIRAHLSQFDAGDPSYDLNRIVPEVNRRFAPFRKSSEKTFEMLLKYAAFMGLVWRLGERPPQSHQRRVVWLTPGVDVNLYGAEAIQTRIADAAQSIGRPDLIDAVDYNNTALLNAKLVFKFPDGANSGRWASEADRHFTEGLQRFPNSLLLRFNQAHWEYFKPAGDKIHAEHLFQGVVQDFPDLDFDATGADCGISYTLGHLDTVFPYYEYADVTTRKFMLESEPNLLGRIEKPIEPRQVLLSACHGYLGALKLQSQNIIGAIHSFAEAIRIFSDGLPVRQLYLEAMIRRCATATLDLELATRLADAMYSTTNLLPTLILTHGTTVIIELIKSGLNDLAHELAAAQQRLGNIVYISRDANNAQLNERTSVALVQYRSVFPSAFPRFVERVMRGYPTGLGRETIATRDQYLITSLMKFEHALRDKNTQLSIMSSKSISGVSLTRALALLKRLKKTTSQSPALITRRFSRRKTEIEFLTAIESDPEARSKYGLFDETWYLWQYPHVMKSGVSPLTHYIEHGVAEGCNPNPLFDTQWYLTKYTDVASAGINPLAHYLTYAKSEFRNPNPLFDTTWYLGQYPFVEKEEINPLLHYIKHGATAGFNPNLMFDSRWYLSKYKDVAKAGVNPLVHYIYYGAAEGRNPGPMFDTDWYLEQSPDVAGSGMNPLAHYLHVGWGERRTTQPGPDFG